MIFLVLSGKMILPFPEIIMSFFRRKMKDDLSQKNTWEYDILFKCSEKMVFPKKSYCNMIFVVVLPGKIIFLFPVNMMLFFRRKMKDDLSQKKKIHRKMIFSWNAPKRWSFQKKWCLNMIFLVLSGKIGVFFPENIFFFGRKMKDDLFQEIHGSMIFSVYM